VSTQPPPPPEGGWPTPEGDTAVRSTEETVAAPAGPPPDEPGNRIGLGMLVGILLVALAAAAIVAAWLITRDNDEKTTTTVVVTTRPKSTTTTRVAVPRLVGLKEQQALLRLGEVGLRPKEVFRPTKQPKNVVVSQKPQEATEVEKGSRVTLVIDSGAPKVAVPAVTGMTADEAVTKLDAVGLDSQQTMVTSAKPAGTVVDQAPAAGAKAAKGSLVTLSVAKAAPVAVPNVVGQSQANATSTLQNAGFDVTPATVPSSEPKGQVVAQSPTAGQRAAKGSKVRINVSDGSGAGTTTAAATTTKPATTRATTTTAAPKNVAVPNVAGSQLQSAVQRLAQSGLLASVRYVPGSEPLETVRDQSPKSGTVKERSHVTVTVSSGPGQKAQKTVPNVVGQSLQGAVSAVNGAGLRLIFVKLPITDRTQAGKIVEQSPAAGRTAPENAQVLVYLGAFRG
jgi:beta-lactam-binding protein with PASTA domain